MRHVLFHSLRWHLGPGLAWPASLRRTSSIFASSAVRRGKHVEMAPSKTSARTNMKEIRAIVDRCEKSARKLNNMSLKKFTVDPKTLSLPPRSMLLELIEQGAHCFNLNPAIVGAEPLREMRLRIRRVQQCKPCQKGPGKHASKWLTETIAFTVFTKKPNLPGICPWTV